MKTHKWALRVVGALIGFTAVIWITAPVQAAELTEQQVVEYVENEAYCYALTKITGDEYQQNRHMFNLRPEVVEHSYLIIHTMGYTEGYVQSASNLIYQSPQALAQKAYDLSCLEES